MKSSVDHRTAGRRQRAKAKAPLYEALDWVLVRAPLHPIERYLTLGEADVESFRADPDVRRALAVGGGELLPALERASARPKEAIRNRGKLLRYLIRMSTRPTPYGLFAGVALAEWGAVTNLSFADARPRMRTRPDMEWLLSFVLALEAVPEVRRGLRLFANPASFLHAGRLYLSEPAPAGGGHAGRPAVSVRATGAVLRALELARAPVRYSALVEELAARPGASRERAEELVETLWRQTFLLTDLRPPLTAADPARHVAERLAGIPAAKEASAQLGSLLQAMSDWDASPPEAGDEPYRKVVALASAAADRPGATPAQVDMALPLAGDRVSEQVASEAVRAAELLLRITPLPAGVPQLDAYRHAFETRYPGREVPLVELVDPSFGLGAPSAFGHAQPVDPARAAARSEALRDLALRALRDRELVVELDDDLLGRLETWHPEADSAPTSLDVSVFVLAPSAAAVDAGEFALVIGPNLGGSAAGRNLGRFADLLAPAGAEALARAAQAEARHAPDCICAELVYLPHRLRSANVVVRPPVRTHEIVLGTTPGVPPDRVIPLAELVVSVRDGRFCVRWPRGGAEIVACSGHMLNNMQAPPAIRFLADLAHQAGPQLSGFDWGPAYGFPFLPRVEAGRVILVPAQWRLDRHVRAGELADASPARFEAALDAWRARWQVPRHVYLAFGDNRLLLDLEDASQVEEFRTELERLEDSSFIVLHEALPGPDDAWARGPEGRFLTELVVPLVLRGGGTPARLETRDGAARPHAAPRAERSRPPGSEWLFAKLYCPEALEDDLLAGPMREFCEYVDAARLAEQWFFIRYSDPDRHVRLRFQATPERLLRDLLPQLTSWAGSLVDEGLCTRLCLDTYERELERYGGEAGMAAAETVFAADSRATARLLALAREGAVGLEQTLVVVVTIDDLLAGLGLGEHERLEWYRGRVRSRHTSGPEYRRHGSRLRSLLGDPAGLAQEAGGEAVAGVLASRRQALMPAAARLRELSDDRVLEQPLESLYGDFVHLHCNRLASAPFLDEELALGLLLRTREGLEKAPLGR